MTVVFVVVVIVAGDDAAFHADDFALEIVLEDVVDVDFNKK
jgi:hypothetical protein